MVQLKILQPGEDERVLPLGDEPITVGRAGDSTVKVSDVKLSRKHCMFSPSPRGYCVEDLNSRNGTKVNEKTVSRHLLRHGDTVQIGSTRIVFHNPPKERAPAPEAAAPNAAVASFSLLARGGAEGGRIITLQGPLTVGRGSGNDLSLDYEEVSGRHARFAPRDDTFVLEDLQSTNGTLVNGIRVNQALLKHGDDVEIGPEALLFFDPDASDKEAVKRRFLRRKHTREAEFSFVDAEGLGDGVAIADIPFLIGSSEENHLVIDRDTVSTKHARLQRDKTGFHIEDLDSTNGTYVGGRKVRRHRVGHGDEITFGDAAFFLKNEEFPLPQDGDTPEEESKKRVVFYMGFAILAVVVVVALFAILDLMESKSSKLSDPGNLLTKNPSFEKATADGGLRAWDLAQAGGARMGLDRSSRTHGQVALKITCPDDFPPGGRVVCRGRDSMKLKAGDVYVFGADVKVSSCQGLAGLRIRWTGGGSPSYSHLVTGSTAWLSIRTHLKVPAGVREAEVDLVTFGPAGTVWFDNVRVEKGDPGRKGWGLMRLADKRLAADMSPRGQWALLVENEEKISGGAFSVASSAGEHIGGQDLAMPAMNYPRAGVGYELRGEILALVDGFSIPFEEKAEMGEDSLTLTYLFDPEHGLGRGDMAVVSFDLPASFASWGLTALSRGREKELPFGAFGACRNVSTLIFRDRRDVLRLELDRPAVLRGFPGKGNLRLVLSWTLTKKDVQGLVPLRLRWVLPPGRLEARGLELLQKAHDHFKKGELGRALVIFGKVYKNFAALKHLADTAKRMATNIEEGAVRARGEIDRALQTVSETADKKSLEDLLFKVRKFQKIFEGSGHGTSAAMLEKRALDIYAEKSGSEVFQRQLVLYRDARAAYELDDWVEAVRLLEKITDSLEDTPILPSAEELLTTIVRRQRDTSEVEEYVNVKFSTAREREEAGDLSRAVLALLEIVRRYPKSKWGKTATREIQRLKVQ